MEPEKQESSSTLVLEKEAVKTEQENKIIIEPSLSPKIEALIKEKLHKNVEEEQKIKINLNPKKEQVYTSKAIEEKKFDILCKEDIVISEIEPLYQSGTSIQKENSEVETPVLTPKKSKKFRMKLALYIYALICSTFIGWTIGNAIAINNQALLLETKSAEYSVNLASYTMKIQGLDGILAEEEKPDSLNPIEAQITVVPEEMVPPQEYIKQSNWFDNICNWLSNLFRR